MLRLRWAIVLAVSFASSIVAVDAIGWHLLPAHWSPMARSEAQLLIAVGLFALVGACLVGVARRTFLK